MLFDVTGCKVNTSILLIFLRKVTMILLLPDCCGRCTFHLVIFSPLVQTRGDCLVYDICRARLVTAMAFPVASLAIYVHACVASYDDRDWERKPMDRRGESLRSPRSVGVLGWS